MRAKLNPSFVLAGIFLIWSCAGVEVKPPPAEEQDRLKEMVGEIVANAAKSPVPPKTTRFSEAELNTLLNRHLQEFIPSGISEPQVRLLGDSRISVRVLVDIDEFKRKRSGRTSTGPLGFFSGKKPATIHGELHTQDGQGQFKLRSAEISGLPLPRALALELLSTYTKSRRNPDGFDLEKPFELPLKLRHLVIGPAEIQAVQ